MSRKTEPVPGWEQAERVQGWYDKREARLLASLVTGLWVEVGCHHGRSTIVLAETGYDGYAIDTFLGSPEMPRQDSFEVFMRNLEEYENVVVVRQDFRKVSEHLIPYEVTLLHLDADHSYEMTKAAFEKFAPKVVPGGHVAFHDGAGRGWPGVEKFIAEIDEQEWEWADRAGKLVALQKL